MYLMMVVVQRMQGVEVRVSVCLCVCRGGVLNDPSLFPFQCSVREVSGGTQRRCEK